MSEALMVADSGRSRSDAAARHGLGQPSQGEDAGAIVAQAVRSEETAGGQSGVDESLRVVVATTGGWPNGEPLVAAKLRPAARVGPPL